MALMCRHSSACVCSKSVDYLSEWRAFSFQPPSVSTETPFVFTEMPSVFTEMPSVFTETPSVFTETPSVYTETPSVYTETPSVYTEILTHVLVKSIDIHNWNTLIQTTEKWYANIHNWKACIKTSETFYMDYWNALTDTSKIFLYTQLKDVLSHTHIWNHSNSI